MIYDIISAKTHFFNAVKRPLVLSFPFRYPCTSPPRCPPRSPRCSTPRQTYFLKQQSTCTSTAEGVASGSISNVVKTTAPTNHIGAARARELVALCVHSNCVTPVRCNGTASASEISFFIQMKQSSRCGMSDAGVGVVVSALLLQACATCVSCVSGEPDSTACSRLLSWGAGERQVTVRGVPAELVVSWAPEASHTARAHAALLAFALRRLRYGRVRLLARDAPQQAGHPSLMRLNISVGAGAASLRSGAGCASSGAALLQARLAHTDAGCALAAAWPFYRSDAELSACAFLRVSDVHKIDGRGEEGAADCPRCLALASTARLAAQARVIEARAATAGLALRVVEREPLLLLEAADNRSLLFFEEPLWSDDARVLVVQPPPCARATDCLCTLALHAPVDIRGHDTLLSYYAPPVFDAVSSFVPSAADIREVLTIAARHDEDDIEEAACEWGLRHPDRLIRWNSTDTVRYRIRLFVCADDPDRGEYEQMAKVVLMSLASDAPMLSINTTSIECASDDGLLGPLSAHQDKRDEHQTIGWLTPNAGADKIQRQFQKFALPLIAYAAPADGLRPNRVVRATAGSKWVYVRALVQLLQRCGARRLAVLSQEGQSAHARDLLAAVRAAGVPLRERNVSLSDESIGAALADFRDSGARVFFVNGEAMLCALAVCAAERAGMAAARDYVWLVREWHGAQRCGARGALRPWRVGLAWRGAAGAEAWARGAVGAGGAARLLDARWAGRAWPVLAAPLADGLSLLVRTLADFLHRHPESAYDRYVFGNAANFSKALNATSIAGIMETITYEEDTYELSSAWAFVERWERAGAARRTLLAAWRVRAGGLQAHYEAAALCAPAFRVTPTCYSTSSGDPFAPRCHDAVWLTMTVVLLTASLALAFARRQRLRQLKLRDLALLEQLVEQRRSSSSRFASCLVSRGEFELREKLGCGEYGRVRVAVLRRAGRPPAAVAAKEPAEERLQDEADLIREAGVLFSLEHENIVRFVGVCLDGRALLFMEHAFFGDLERYLRARRPLAEFMRPERAEAEAVFVSARALSSLGAQAAAALQYLAARRVVHRDVRAANCLVDETRRLKLADFGLARRLDDDGREYVCRHRRRLPAACMAPESLLHGVFSPATDVWALGVLLLELVTLGEPPYGRADAAAIMALVAGGRHPPAPHDASPPAQELLEWCWRRCACERPSAEQVLHALRRHPDALAPVLLAPVH
ncbi:uncharacterized protein [Battus philenor]|uniref:uncharacterized protein n=1 Tax=Battus philenor TaxID=42288 RepID=UPI0035D0CA4B